MHDPDNTNQSDGRKFADIPADKKTWRVFVSGEEVPDATSVLLILDNPAKNMKRVVELGFIDDQRGNTYDGIRYWELGGGGSVSLPYIVIDDVLWVAVITQYRVHAGSEVDNAPRGYQKIGNDSRKQSADEELAEEVGVQVLSVSSGIMLGGDPVNMNSAVFDTSHPGEGNTFFAYRIASMNVIIDEHGRPWFKPGLVAPEGGESIVKCHFLRWDEALQLKDGLTIVAVARLIAQLVMNAEIELCRPR